jgi:hypothetical protein
MEIENTTTEEITKLLCQVMESKAGQTDGEIVDEFEKKLKLKYCTHEHTENELSNFDGYRHYNSGEFINGSAQFIVVNRCMDCGTVISKERYHCKVVNIVKEE